MVQLLKHRSRVAGIDPAVIELLQDPAKRCFAVGTAIGQVAIAQGNGALKVAVVGKHPGLPAPAAREGMAVLQRHHAAGGLADVGDAHQGLGGTLRQLVGKSREGRRGFFPQKGEAGAIWVAIGGEAGQAPAIGMLAAGATTPAEPPEGEAHVGGGVGVEGEQFTHGRVAGAGLAGVGE